jgi:L-alanine-DL-glutamate epimerase-like enolase superfamily enzyme
LDALPRITHLDFRPIDVPLTEPFGIAGGAQLVAENVLVEVGLEGGALGIGEAAPFPAFNRETRADAVRVLEASRDRLLGIEAAHWRAAARVSQELLHAAPSALCAFETALLDALTRSLGLSLFAFFGGAEPELYSDITLTTGSAEQAEHQAARAYTRGFRLLKLKVGGVPLPHDLERLARAAAVAPDAGFVLDANASLRADEAIRMVRALGALRERVVLFEQPVAAGDLVGMRAVREAGVRVAADESATSVADVSKIIAADAADVINVKIMKSGVVGALEMAYGARTGGLELMIGGLVETRLAMSMSACLAGGIGGFTFVDLDTPLFIAKDPFRGGFADEYPRLALAGIEQGHGVLC